VAGTPVDIRRAALHSMRRLLPRMPLAGYAAAVLHPLLRCLDGGPDELRRDAADTICALALALGPDFALFVPTIRKARARPALRAPAPLRLGLECTACFVTPAARAAGLPM
jgi:FKBP12-rapamycin complex-associated protein